MIDSVEMQAAREIRSAIYGQATDSEIAEIIREQATGPLREENETLRELLQELLTYANSLAELLDTNFAPHELTNRIHEQAKVLARAAEALK